jgi:hypothetical protein
MCNRAKMVLKTGSLIKYFIISVVVASVFFGCASKSVRKETPPEYSFYELCFYFERVPEGTADSDIADASELYSEHLENRGITVFKKRNYSKSACFFTDQSPDFSKPVKMTSNNISQYLLNAYFDKESSSLIGIEKVGGNFDVLFASSTQRTVLPIYFQVEDGVSIEGNSSDIVFISRYLEVLDIEHQFGINQKGKMIVNIPRDFANRWMLVPFLYETIDISKYVTPKPGDYSILSECENELSEIFIFVPSWEKSEVTFTEDFSISKEDSLLFSSSILSLPFNEDVFVRYFYSLKGSHLFPPSSAIFYSPNFTGGVIFPKVYLLSSEIAIDGAGLSPERILLWLLSVESEIKDYSNTLYSNILSLKVARKLYTGTPKFLGGSELFNSTSSIPFESIRKYLFSKGNVSVFGSIKNTLYVNNDEIILEYPSFENIESVKGFNAFFGSSDMSCGSVVSIVFRSPKALELKNKVKKILNKEGYSIIQTLFEQISENDSWGAVSLMISQKEEKEFLEFYSKKIKNKHRSMSLGVYRVPE